MFGRTTAILGAGAVLDFDYNGIVKPTTDNITKEVIELKIQGYDEIDSELIKHIYDSIVESSRVEYLRLHPAVRHYESYITFEDLFEVIETLYSYSGTWKHEHYPFSLISTLLKSNLDNYPGDYYRAMLAIIKKIVKIVMAYDELFKRDGREMWYKNFWKSFDGRVDVFNLNYDTTVENSLEDYVDGFVNFTPRYKRFEPEVLWNVAADKATINHLHGCILYGDPNPKQVEFHYSHYDLYKFYSAKDAVYSLGHRLFLPQNQVKDSLFYTPIITGLKKTDKICYIPHNFYHANLAKKVIENSSLLICGYSFGDLYVNQLLQRHKLIHDKNERVIIIEKWPDYVNQDCLSLYRYFMDKTTSGFKEYVERITESGKAPLESFKLFKQVSEGCWESKNGVLRLYTKGFKSTIVEFSRELMGFIKVEE